MRITVGPVLCKRRSKSCVPQVGCERSPAVLSVVFDPVVYKNYPYRIKQASGGRSAVPAPDNVYERNRLLDIPDSSTPQNISYRARAKSS